MLVSFHTASTQSGRSELWADFPPSGHCLLIWGVTVQNTHTSLVRVRTFRKVIMELPSPTPGHEKEYSGSAGIHESCYRRTGGSAYHKLYALPKIMKRISVLRPHYLDASAMVKLVVEGEYSDRVRGD